MGRSGFNVPVFSDSAVNQSDERSGIVGQQPVYLFHQQLHALCARRTYTGKIMTTELNDHHGTVDITSKCLNVTFKMLPGYVHNANEKQHLFRYEILNIKMRKSIRLPASNKTSASKSCRLFSLFGDLIGN